MKEAAAKALAEQYLQRNPIDHPDLVWILGAARATRFGWYFDFAYRSLQERPEDAEGAIGGAPGFLVLPDGNIRVVGWEELERICPPDGAGA